MCHPLSKYPDTPCYLLQVTGYLLQVTGYLLQVTGYLLQVTGCMLHKGKLHFTAALALFGKALD